MPDGFSRFLEEKRGSTGFDSHGKFTVSGTEALRKLTRYSLQRPGDWVLKAVQAAVAGGASALHIDHLRDRVEVRFQLKVRPCPEAFGRALLSPERPASPLLRELCYGLRALLLRHQITAVWAEGNALFWNGSELETKERPSSKVPFRVSVSLDPKSRSSTTAEQLRLLRNRASHCPIPLYLDGRLVTVQDLKPRSSVNAHAQHSPRFLASGYFGRNWKLERPIMDTANWWTDPLRTQRSLAYWPLGRGPAAASFGLHVSHQPCEPEWTHLSFLPDSFDLLWTRYGVVCAWKTLEQKPLGGFLQVECEHLRPDISGLEVEVDRKTEQDTINRLPELLGPMQTVHDYLVRHPVHTTVGDALLFFTTGYGLAQALWRFFSFGSSARFGDPDPVRSVIPRYLATSPYFWLSRIRQNGA